MLDKVKIYDRLQSRSKQNQRRWIMVIRDESGDIIGRVITNHSMTIYEACDFAGIDAGHTEDNEYDIDTLTMDYDTD